MRKLSLPLVLVLTLASALPVHAASASAPAGTRLGIRSALQVTARLLASDPFLAAITPVLHIFSDMPVPPIPAPPKQTAPTIFPAARGQ